MLSEFKNGIKPIWGNKSRIKYQNLNTIDNLFESGCYQNLNTIDTLFESEYLPEFKYNRHPIWKRVSTRI